MTDKPNDEKKGIAEEIEKAKKLLNDISNPPENKLYLVKRINELLEKVNTTPPKTDDPYENRLPNITVYRIMKLEHLISDIDDEVITFTHPSCFHDVTESKEENALFAQCWTTEPATPAMWREYASDKQGIMIKFDCKPTDDDNKQNNSTLFQPFFFNTHWHEIIYDYDIFKDSNDANDPLEQLFHKRKEYNNEKEYRWVADLRDLSWFPSYSKIGDKEMKFPKLISTYTDGCYKRFIQLPFSRYLWGNIISEIVIDPSADDNFFKYARDLLKAKIPNSSLKVTRSPFNNQKENLDDTTNSELQQLYNYSERQSGLTVEDLKMSNNNKNLKLYLFAIHDYLVFNSNQTIDKNYLIQEADITLLREEKSYGMFLYLTSYAVLETMMMINDHITGKNKEKSYERSIPLLCQQMFEEIGRILNDEDIAEKTKDTHFINNITDFWINNNTDTSKHYYAQWINVFFKSQSNIHTFGIKPEDNNHELQRYRKTMTTKIIRDFYNTITQPYFDSLKEEPKP